LARELNAIGLQLRAVGCQLIAKPAIRRIAGLATRLRIKPDAAFVIELESCFMLLVAAQGCLLAASYWEVGL